MKDGSNIEAPSWKGVKPVGERFGKRLRELREERGISQIQLDMRVSVNRSFISELENGHKVPTLITLEALAQGFKMTISELLEGV